MFKCSSAGALLLASFVFTACNTNPKSNGPARPIIMGDPATIVTETDSQYLRDALPDFEGGGMVPPLPKAVVEAPKDTVATPAATLPAESGLTIEFGDLNVIIPGAKVRNDNKSAKGASSVAYSSEEADASGIKNLLLSGDLKVERVQQKADYGLVWSAEGRDLPLFKTGTETTGWQTLNNTKNTYKTAPLSPPKFNVSAASLRAAATDAAKRARLSRAETSKLNSAAGKLRSVNDGSVKPVLRTLMWQVKGKDSRGRTVSREIRIDMPV